MLRKLLGLRRLRAIAEQDKILWVSPPAVNIYTEFWTKRLADTPVRGGNWDLNISPISEHPTFRGLCEHFKNGVEWQKTALFNTPGFTYLQRFKTLKANAGNVTHCIEASLNAAYCRTSHPTAVTKTPSTKARYATSWCILEGAAS